MSLITPDGLLLPVTQYFIVNSHANSVRCQEMELVASLTAVDVCALHYCGQSVQIMLSAHFPQFHSCIQNKRYLWLYTPT
jgi:hypothetical protein